MCQYSSEQSTSHEGRFVVPKDRTRFVNLSNTSSKANDDDDDDDDDDDELNIDPPTPCQ